MPLKPEDKQPIVDAHNAYRRDPAIHAPNLQWDSTLAAGAQQWADNLATNVHDLVHSGSDVRGNNIGESIAASSPGSSTPAQMVDQWGKGVPGMADKDIEQRNFQPGIFSNSTTTCPVSKTGNWQDVGHYTQMIWNDSASVGCGFASDSTYDYLVCRYAPAGNVSGVRVPSLQPVTLAQVSVADAKNAFGVDAANTVYRYTSDDGTNWTQTSITSKQIKLVSIAKDNTVCGLDSNGAIWQYSLTSSTWTQLPGGPVAFKHFSCGSATNIWAVGTNGTFYQYNGSSWRTISSGAGSGTLVSAASDGTVWEIAYTSGLYYFVPPDFWSQPSVPPGLGGGGTHLSCGSATNVWVIGGDGLYYQYNGTNWTTPPVGSGGTKQVSVASDGTVWAIGKDNRVSRYVNNAWTPLLV